MVPPPDWPSGDCPAHPYRRLATVWEPWMAEPRRVRRVACGPPIPLLVGRQVMPSLVTAVPNTSPYPTAYQSCPTPGGAKSPTLTTPPPPALEGLVATAIQALTAPGRSRHRFLGTQVRDQRERKRRSC